MTHLVVRHYLKNLGKLQELGQSVHFKQVRNLKQLWQQEHLKDPIQIEYLVTLSKPSCDPIMTPPYWVA